VSVGEFGTHPGHGSIAILKLRTLRFASDHEASGLVPELNSAGYLVAILPARPRAASGLPFDIALMQDEL
jgi:hypothetical protein